MERPFALRSARPELPVERHSANGGNFMEFAQRRRVETSSGAAAQRGPSVAQPSHRAARKARHAGIFEAVHRMDAGLDPAAREALGRWIRDEYEREYGEVPIGLFAMCHLGAPYVDHRLDLFQSIVEHYTAADAVPPQFAAARILVRTGAYDFIEVYSGGDLKPILKDGSVVA